MSAKNSQRQFWFTRSAIGNRKAVIPLWLALIGSLLWQSIAFWNEPVDSPAQGVWNGILWIGAVLMALGFIGGCIFWRYRVGGLAIVISLASPFLWAFVLLWLYGFRGSDAPFPIWLWLALQVPWAAMALWRAKMPLRAKTMIAGGAAFALAGGFVIQTVRNEREVSDAPHMTAAQLDAIYHGGTIAQRRHFRGRWIVVTGIVGGQSEGLFGDEPPEMQNDIEFDNLGVFDTIDDGQKAAIIGTCQGLDRGGVIHMAQSRIIWKSPH